ncbi:MAG: glyoxalase/bleomycin resistance/dioxygenase family protein [Caulobacteraceae bacterium]|nr:glyoxalase/bleomycin resistance/dioxygenase family protein [Caulobacteraceae bacterium]
MQARLTYAIKYGGHMDRAVAFHRDSLGLKLRFASPSWSEFDTGEVTLALQAAGEGHPPAASRSASRRTTCARSARREPRTD